MQIIFKIIIGIIGIMLTMAFAAPIEELVVDNEGNATFNCADDPEYNSAINTNTLGCTFGKMVTPIMLILITIGTIGWIVYSPNVSGATY